MKKKLELTDKELNIILFSLQKQSFELVHETIQVIVTQLQSQTETEKENEKE